MSHRTLEVSYLSGVREPPLLRYLVLLGAGLVGIAMLLFLGAILGVDPGRVAATAGVALLLASEVPLVLIWLLRSDTEDNARQRLRRHGVATAAQVTWIDLPRAGRQIRYRYFVDGVEHQGEVPRTLQTVGDLIEIVYDPDDPDVSGQRR